MNISLKILAIIGGIFGLFIVAGLLLFFSTFSDMCGNRIVEAIESPGKEWQIVVYERDCGATTDYSTQVSIIQVNDELPNASGNIFSADSGHGQAKVNELGIIDVTPQWIDSRTILVTYDSAATVYKQESDWNGITINYQKTGHTQQEQ